MGSNSAHLTLTDGTGFGEPIQMIDGKIYPVPMPEIEDTLRAAEASAIMREKFVEELKRDLERARELCLEKSADLDLLQGWMPVELVTNPCWLCSEETKYETWAYFRHDGRSHRVHVICQRDWTLRQKQLRVARRARRWRRFLRWVRAVF